MDNMIEFDLISPERRLLAGRAASVRLPSVEGDFTAMAGHAPVVSELRPGIVVITDAENTQDYLISGGFAEVTGEKISILADTASHVSEVEAAHIEEMLETAKAQAHASEGAGRDRAEKIIADLTALLEMMA